MTPEELAAHEARHQALREAWAEVARLRDWKAEALTVLADWEGVTRSGTGRRGGRFTQRSAPPSTGRRDG